MSDDIASKNVWLKIRLVYIRAYVCKTYYTCVDVFYYNYTGLRETTSMKSVIFLS